MVKEKYVGWIFSQIIQECVYRSIAKTPLFSPVTTQSAPLCTVLCNALVSHLVSWIRIQWWNSHSLKPLQI